MAVVTVEIKLTAAQVAALERVGDDCKIVGAWLDTPVVRQPNGRLFRISPTGRVLPATRGLEEDLETRVIDMLAPKGP